MRLLDNIRNFFRRSKAVEEEPVASAPRTGSVNIFAPAGMDLSIATVYRCVNILADSVANLPVQYMRLKGDIFVEDKTKTMNRKTSQGETPVFVNLLSDAGFEAVKSLQKKV